MAPKKNKNNSLRRIEKRKLTMANHGETDIDKLIAGMKPKLTEGDYVFCLVSSDSAIYYSKISRKDILMEFKEIEGITLILKKDVADKYADDEGCL